jgi:hypothetical protein
MKKVYIVWRSVAELRTVNSPISFHETRERAESKVAALNHINNGDPRIIHFYTEAPLEP